MTSIKVQSDLYNVFCYGVPNPNNAVLLPFNSISTIIYIKRAYPKAKILFHDFCESSHEFEKIVSEYTDIGLRLNYARSLYPIQSSDEFASMIVTRDCRIIKTENGVIVNPPIFIDVASLDAIHDPIKKNLDIHSRNNDDLLRLDFSMDNDKISTSLRLELLYKYAIGEKYDFLITGDWGFEAINPEWGIINIWNTILKNIPTTNLKVLFCIPHSRGVGQNYRFFRKYLVGQPPLTEVMPVIQPVKKKVVMFQQDDDIVNKKIKSLIWGLILSDINEEASNGGGNSNLLLTTLRAIGATDKQVISTELLAKYLVEWTNGEYPPNKNNGIIDQVIAHVVSQSQYINNPKKVAMQVYVSKSSCDPPQCIYEMIVAAGIFKNWQFIISNITSIIWPDKGLVVGTSVVGFIINHLWNDVFITNSRFSKLKKSMCDLILGNDKNNFNYINLNQQFDKYWMAAMNYKNQIHLGLENYIKHICSQGYLLDTSVFWPMMMGIIVLLDIQSKVKVKDILVTDIWNTPTEESLNDTFEDAPCIMYLEDSYYFDVINLVKLYTKNTHAISIVGSIVGIACWNSLYNTTMTDPIPLYQTHIQKILNSGWLDQEIDSFVQKYIYLRSKALGR